MFFTIWELWAREYAQKYSLGSRSNSGYRGINSENFQNLTVFEDFLKGELLLTEAANRLELTTKGIWEKDTIKRFHDFITTKELPRQKRIVTACVKYEEIHAWMREIELCSRMHAGAATNINKLHQELIEKLDKKK